MRLTVLLLALSLGLGCSDDDSNPSVADMAVDVGVDMPNQDSDMSFDMSAPDLFEDMSVADMTPDASDAGADFDDMPDLAIEPFGSISGTCGDVDAEELNAPGPFFFANAIEFNTEFMDPSDRSRLTPGAVEILEAGNAGGSSIYSETFSYEVLQRCEMASLLKTETEIVYDTQGTITDLLIQLDGQKIGVSVTRSVTFPRDTPLTSQRAEDLLNSKLGDILESSTNVSAEDAWTKQILHVVADRPEHVSTLETAWNGIDMATRADTIVYVTVTNGADDFVY